MRYLCVILLPCLVFFCSCRTSELNDEIAELHAELNLARAEAEVAKAELRALKDAGALTKRALDGTAAELAKQLPTPNAWANPLVRAQAEQARAAYEGTTPAPAPVTPPTEDEQVLAFGKGFIGDLEQNRLTSAYRLTSPEYQKEVERKMFDELVEKYPRLNRLEKVVWREEKVRKAPDGKEWEYYCTAREISESQFSAETAGAGPRVNFALTITKDGTAWRVTSLEIAREKTP